MLAFPTFRRGFLPALLAIILCAGHAAAAKEVYIPSSWASTGEVPWTEDRTKQSNNFVLLWGEKSGTNPVSAPSDYAFDPDDIITQLEKLYSFYVNDMKFTPEAGLLAQYKIIVIITRTWNRVELDGWATGGSAEGKVGVINVAPGAALPGSWGLAHELGHVFQNLAFLGKSGLGFTDASSGFFWEASAEYMAMQVYPDGGAGDLTRFLRTDNLAYSSTRHHYGAWMWIQYIVDKNNNNIEIFNRLWNEAKNTEHPLQTYERIAGLTHQQFNERMGEYGQHQVTYDYTNKAHFQQFVDSVYGYEFINAFNGIAVDAVNKDAGHYAVPTALAPSDYGYNKIKLVPSSSGALIKLHFKGHENSAAGSGWSYGFVGVTNKTPRYGPIYTAADKQIEFQTNAGEEVYLVVVGAPSTVHKYSFESGYTNQYRYPYEFGISGAVPSGYEAGYTKPAAVGGSWHSNGGGWVSSRATVASTAYVGPRAAVYGSSTVSGNARIEGLAWVNSGATISGNAVVKDNALIQGGANLSGSIVVGGDAELAIACSSGTYLRFDGARGCDGKAGETDVNPTITHFTDAQVAIS
ncbi:hypothetical protein V2G26_004558 [Clonostachys chloroleuca]